MKYIFFIFFFFTFLLGCNRDEIVFVQPWGSVLVKFNGVGKQFVPYSVEYEGLMDIILNCSKCDNNIDYDLSFSNIRIEEYKIDTLNSYSAGTTQEYASLFSLFGGDVIGAGYSLLSNEKNFLEITYWNPITDEVKGKFQVSFIRDANFTSASGLDTVRYMNGEFHTRIIR